MKPTNKSGVIIATLKKQNSELKEQVADDERSWRLRVNADHRAIRMWQAKHIDRPNVWPDHADMCVWLMELVDLYMELEDELPTAALADTGVAAVLRRINAHRRTP